jgi:hypothetical protein
VVTCEYVEGTRHRWITWELPDAEGSTRGEGIGGQHLSMLSDRYLLNRGSCYELVAISFCLVGLLG